MELKFGNKKIIFNIGKKEETKPSFSFESEVTILNEFIDSYLSEFKDKLQVVSNSSDYTTLQYNERDLLRLKYSNNTKWITIFIIPKYKNDYIDNELFKDEKNKNKLQWKSVINDKKDLSKFVSICLRDIEFFNE